MTTCFRSSSVVISKGKGGRRYLPYVFTEQGVAMLSSVLRCERAVQVNIAIMRVFVRLREMLAVHRELAVKLEQLEGRIEAHDEQIQAVFEAIRQLMRPPETERKRIGFEINEPAARYKKGKSSVAPKQV
ncbi:MAG: ORF6N domain-containing protein [Deltaproteobacteria bacterium]|nr:ORF6N domain-containing protein [Deltaproteobacteria bacterium]